MAFVGPFLLLASTARVHHPPASLIVPLILRWRKACVFAGWDPLEGWAGAKAKLENVDVRRPSPKQSVAFCLSLDIV